MVKTRQSLNTSTRLAARVSTLTQAAIRALNAVARERALAQRAALTAALHRQRLAELRVLYTTPDTVLASVRVDKAARSAAFESFEFPSDYEEKRAA